MTKRLNLSVLDLSIKGVAPIIEQVRPGWKSDNVKRTLYYEGRTNSLAAFYQDTIEDEDTIVIRINGAAPFVDRQKELETFDRLVKADICELLVASFNNGLVMKRIKGSTLTKSNVSNKIIALSTAHEIAKMHLNLQLSRKDKVRKILLKQSTVTQQRYRNKTALIISHIPKHFSKQSVQSRCEELNLPSRRELELELNKIERFFAKQSTPLVICHNDLHMNNMLYDHEHDVLKIIDYEYLEPNPAAYDLANHFNEYAGCTNLDYTNVPCETYQKWWLIEYLTVFYGPEKVTDELVQEWFDSVQYMQPVSHLLWGCYWMAKAEMENPELENFDCIGYAKLRLDQYYIQTNQLFKY